MVEVGTLNIKGSLDTSNIIRGQREISRGFETVKQKTQSSFLSMDMLAGSAAQLGNALTNVTTAAVGGLTVLAGLTPTLAPEFAKIKVETFKLAQVFGREFKPALETVTGAYSQFVNFIGQDTNLANFTRDVISLTATGGALALLASKLLGIKGIGKIVIPIAVGVAVKRTLEEPIAGAIERGLGFLGLPEERTATPVPGIPAIKGRTDVAAGLGALVTNLIAGAIIGGGAGAFVGGVGAAPGALLGGVAGAGYTIYEIVRDDYFSNVDSSGR